MAKVRQLAKTFLRGSLVNETIAHLTPAQAGHVDAVTTRVLNDPVMAGHRSEFLRKLATTIAADYRDSEAADQEFRIAIWRGVAQLLYHSGYSFQCTHCGQSEYISHYGKMIPIISRAISCPACHHCRIADPGDSGLVAGSLMLFDEAQAIAEELRTQKKSESDNPKVPVIVSCVAATAGDKKYDASQVEQILSDSAQLSKWFGAFARNYISQILSENAIPKHGRGIEIRCGAADKLIADRISNLLIDVEVAHTYTNNRFPTRMQASSFASHIPPETPAAVSASTLSCCRAVSGNYYCISVDQFCLPPRCILQFVAIWREAARAGVKIEFDSNMILVSDTGAAPVIQLPFTTNAEVSVLDPQNHQDEEGPTTMVETIENRADDTDIGALERREAFDAIRRSLQDERARRLLDIYLGSGPAHEEFKKQFPSGAQPAKNHIAKFLGCSSGEVANLRMQIGGQLLAHGIS